jgi:hypothetical protein
MKAFLISSLKNSRIKPFKLANEYFQRRHLFNLKNSSFSQLGETFNQKPVSNYTYKKSPNPSNSTSQLKKFTNILSTINPTNNNSKNSTGLFGINELKHFEGFYQLQDDAKHKVEYLIDEANNFDLFNQNSDRNLVSIFDDISNELCRVADLAEFVRTSHPDINYRQSANMVIF